MELGTEKGQVLGVRCSLAVGRRQRFTAYADPPSAIENDDEHENE